MVSRESNTQLCIHSFLHVQEHVIPSIPHKDYLPDITGPDPQEHDYEPDEEESPGVEEEYEDYPEREND